jgi:hypothetical protein
MARHPRRQSSSYDRQSEGDLFDASKTQTPIPHAFVERKLKYEHAQVAELVELSQDNDFPSRCCNRISE